MELDLTETILFQTGFHGSNMNNARMGRTIFSDMTLSDVAGLKDVNHLMPSTLGIDTIQNSVGNIPQEFLRGCGLSDWEIEAVKLYSPDLTNDERNKILYKMYDLQASQAVQVSPLFISYSHADSEFVDKIGNSLQQKAFAIGVTFTR